VDQHLQITINYLEHIQPIWDACRPQAGGKSCTSCHNKADNTPQNNCTGGGGADGKFELTGDPDPWNPGEVASYVQLFEPAYYALNANGEWILVTDPATECPNGIEGDLSVEPLNGICITRRLMSARGAIASARFSGCLMTTPTTMPMKSGDRREHGHQEGPVVPQRHAHAGGTAVDRRVAGHRCPLL
jgi:hypothetical protein